MKLLLSRICYFHNIRKPTFHVPNMIYDYTKQLVQYQITKRLTNENKILLITAEIYTYSFQSCFLYNLIDLYQERCHLTTCYTCERCKNTHSNSGLYDMCLFSSGLI